MLVFSWHWKIFQNNPQLMIVKIRHSDRLISLIKSFSWQNRVNLWSREECINMIAICNMRHFLIIYLVYLVAKFRNRFKFEINFCSSDEADEPFERVFISCPWILVWPYNLSLGFLFIPAVWVFFCLVLWFSV